MIDDESLRRARFFGVGDLAAGRYVGRAVEVVEAFDPAAGPGDVMDVLELYNVLKYLEQGMFPVDYGEDQQAIALAKVRAIRGVIGRFFSTLDAEGFASRLVGVEREYHDDLLELLARHGVFGRCAASTVLPALEALGMRLGNLLGCEKLVDAYEGEVRSRLMASPQCAEFVIRKYLVSGERGEVHLPASFTAMDSRELLREYVDTADANPNYLRLIETAPVSSESGVDSKLKLRAKRRYVEWTKQFFAEGSGTSILKTGYEIALSRSQVEPMKSDLAETDDDGLVSKYTYSRAWFDETCDNASILNNFQHLFQFANWQVLLMLPSYATHLGVFDRFLKTTGKSEYVTGAGFEAVDATTLLQTQMYQQYLNSKDQSLEGVFAWFFGEYLIEEFDAANFSFAPSDPGAPYLQRVRHLFSEMESVVAQFSLYAENAELDRELLEITSEQPRYLEIPSLLDGKYVYATTDEEVRGVLFTLFSDQAGMAYLREGLQAKDLFTLIRENAVPYDDFADYQKQRIDRLVGLKILSITDGLVRFGDISRIVVLKSLWATEAASYFHLSEASRVDVDVMVERGWVSRRSTLLTESEGKYFNYFLNNVGFGNGPRLRNRYAHGSQASGDENVHHNTYLTALRLMVALVIKMNDDFCIAAELAGSTDEK